MDMLYLLKIDRIEEQENLFFFFKRGRVSQLDGKLRLRVFVFAESARDNLLIHQLHDPKLLNPLLFVAPSHTKTLCGIKSQGECVESRIVFLE
jgi:hypothetical protein